MAFLAGLVLFLVILEICLRVVGSVYSHLSESDTGSTDKGQVTILTIGDSVTFGIGAPTGFSYPAQLEAIIKKEVPDKNYTVINRGRPGQNSAQILSRAEGWLRQFKPALVTILIGAQNQVNYFGFHDYLKQTDTGRRGFFLRSYDLLDKIRIYRFVSRLVRKQSSPGAVLHLEDNNKRAVNLSGEVLTSGAHDSEIGVDAASGCTIGTNHRERGDFEAMQQAIVQASQTRDIDAACYNIVGSMYKDKNLNDQAVTWFKRGIYKDPGNFNNYEEIGWLYNAKKNPQEALTWFKKGFAQARPDTLHAQCYIGIAQAFSDSDDIEGGIAFFNQEEERRANGDRKLRTLVSDYLSMFKNKRDSTEIHRWIEADIKQLVELCGRYNAQIVLQNYPAEPKVNYIYREVAAELNLPFVDHQGIFEKYIINGKRSDEVFVPDGHPNRKGYAMMAKNLWTVVKEVIQ